MPKVHFVEENLTVQCGRQANLRKVAIQNGIQVYKGLDKFLNCHGSGLCGTCVVEVVNGVDQLPARNRREQFKLKGRSKTLRLSCQTKVTGDIEVRTKPST